MVNFQNKMIGIIQDWLFSQLGIYFNLDKLEESNSFQDGSVLADILTNYGLLNSDFTVNINKGWEQEVCQRNLKLLKPIFDMLSVHFDDNVILDIITNNKVTIIQLLYELYVCLENKQHLYFITQEKFERVQKDHINSLSKNGIFVSSVETEILRKDEDKCFKKSLVDNRDLVEWYKKRFKLIENNLSLRLRQLKDETPSADNYSQIRYSNKRRKHHCPCSCSTGSADQELVAYLPDLDMFHKSNHERLLEYKQFIASFKAKQHRNSAKQCFEKNVQNELLQQTWDKIMKTQNEMYNSVFSQIMLKQSQYEKQTLTKLIQTQQQIKIENENLIYTTSKVLEEEEKQIRGDFEMKEEFEQLKNIYENEQKRVLELHRKLYKRKQDLTNKKHYELCLDVLDSFIDLAISKSEYESNYGVPVSMVLWNSWKQYFFKSQPIHIPFQTLQRSASLDENVNYDDIIDFEKQSSAIVNENDIDEYLYTCGRWFFEDICKDYGSINENTLAFIVYRLLSLKYPPPPPPMPAKLPTFRVAGVLLDFHNVDCIEKLKILLSKPRVHIFDPATAIKTCISKFEEETLGNKDEKTTKKSKQTTSDKKEKKKGGSIVSNKGKKGKKSGKNKKKSEADNDETKGDGIWIESKGGEAIYLSNKETQTSIIDENTITKEIERSALGLIGEQVFTILKEGQKVEDDLLVKVIIEYLKTLHDYDGWVLLNYPTDIIQASIIELALSGKKLPIEDYVLGDEELEVKEDLTDENAPKRKSKILQCPVDEKNKSPFKSYFTVFIKTNPNTNELSEPLEVKLEPPIDHIDENLLQNDGVTESKIIVKDSEIIKRDVLEEFYKDLSIYQHLSCGSSDLVVLKKLARAILNGDGLEQTASVDLFGKEALDKLSKGNKKGKKDKGLALDKNKKTEKTKKGQKKLGSIDVQIATEKTMLGVEDNTNINTELSMDTEQINQTTKESLKSEIVRPGDAEWQFTALPILDDMAAVLATIWENLENCYLQNLEDICFENRMINLRLVPYSTYVKETVKNVATKPDVRQDLVSQFQKYYMGIDKNLRVLSEVKNHIFCKVLEMQQNLWQIIDDKKNEVESKRKEVIHENWLVNELCMLINNYLSLVQTEFDRSVGTYKLVSDYYLSMLEKAPSATINSHLLNSKVTKLTEDNLTFEPYKALQNTKDTEDISSFLRSSSNQSDTIANVVAQNLIDCRERDKVIKIIDTFIPREVERMSTVFTSVTHTFLSQIKTEEDFLIAASKKLAKERNVTEKGNKSTPKGSEKPPGKKNSTGKSKKLSDKSSDKAKGKDVPQTMAFDDNNVEFNRIQKESLLTEWKFAVDTEYDRFKLRMNLISSRAQEDLIEFYCYLESVFCELLSTNLSTYDIDISNTNKLCDYLRTAIEEEALLTYPLVLKRSEFFVDITNNLAKEHDYDEIKELFEQNQDCYFTTNQLKKLMGIFKIAGPHGVIRQQPFCYILQDLMLFNDNNNQPHLPRIWNHLSESQLHFVLEGIFGFEYGINWRDFLIYNLEIPYPSSDEILSLRNLFMSNDLESTEVVSMEIYDSIKLWFEHDLPNNPQEGLRFALIKELLSEMFQVNETMINYTALLLYFCKDYDPKIGLKKALCLSIGKNVITSEKELDETLKEEAEIKASVMNLLENIIYSIVNNKEGILIYEVSESTTDFNFDSIDTNYTVTDKSESESSSVDSEHVVNGIDSKENNFQDEKESLTQGKSLTDNGFLDLDKAWVSKIPITTVISILNASFLHQDKDFSLRNLYLNCLEEESDVEGLIEAHVLVSLECMNKLFNHTNKFKISSPCEILEDCLKREL